MRPWREALELRFRPCAGCGAPAGLPHRAPRGEECEGDYAPLGPRMPALHDTADPPPMFDLSHGGSIV